MHVFSNSWNARNKWSYFVLLVLCIDKVKGERSNVGICLLDVGILQPAEAGGGEGKGACSFREPSAQMGFTGAHTSSVPFALQGQYCPKHRVWVQSPAITVWVHRKHKEGMNKHWDMKLLLLFMV